MKYAAVVAAFVGFAFAAPNIYAYPYSPSNIVKVFAVDDFCLIAPKDAHTPIGVAEGSGTKTYCTTKARYDNSSQGRLPDNFVSDAKVAIYNSPTTGKQIRQISGCIRANTLSRLDPTDEGGQFDSSGQGNNGVPANSFCILPGNNQRGFYVQQIEPADNRFCLRCCVDNNDCPHTNDTKGCEVALPGYYGNSCK